MFQFSALALISEWQAFNLPGCPIRIRADHFPFANPRTFSQLTASFIAARSQGILRSPFVTSLVVNHIYWLSPADTFVLLYEKVVPNFLQTIFSDLFLPLSFLSQYFNELAVVSQTGCKGKDFFWTSKFFCKIFQKKSHLFHFFGKNQPKNNP